jgi:hypothetical protein
MLEYPAGLITRSQREHRKAVDQNAAIALADRGSRCVARPCCDPRQETATMQSQVGVPARGTKDSEF